VFFTGVSISRLVVPSGDLYRILRKRSSSSMGS
jgi:hypothetical protein